MTCPVCKGVQNIMTMTLKRGLEYWPCPCCHGAGVTALYSPPTYNAPKKLKPAHPHEAG